MAFGHRLPDMTIGTQTRALVRLVLCIGLVVFLALIQHFVPLALANNAEYRRCQPDSDCIIGEFLYDDSYVPISTATCTITSRSEAGTLVLDEEALTSNADGWYSYAVDTTPLADGLYRTQICCVVNSENMCLDKSFIVGSSASTLSETGIANAVWEETRTDHATAGTFGESLQENPSSLTAEDIWSYPSRTLTSFGTLVADMWGYVSRTITGAGLDSGNLATKSDVEAVKTEVTNVANNTVNNNESITNQLVSLDERLEETNETLEDLVNEPVVINLVEDSGIGGATGMSDERTVEAKLQRSRETVDEVSDQILSLKTRVNLAAKTWNSRSTKQVRSELSAIARELGADTMGDNDSAGPDSFSSQIRWLQQSWDGPVVERLMIEGDRVLASIKIADLKLSTSGSAANLQAELDAGYSALVELEKIVGSEQDQAGDSTLFAYMHKLEDLNNRLAKQDSELDRVYEKIARYSRTDLTVILDTIQKKVLEVNVVPSALVVLEDSATKEHPENRAYALRGVIGANRLVLARSTESPTVHSWLENGSVIFKFLVTNPSKKTQRTVAVRFQLPRELQEQDIMDKSPGISVGYDTTQEALVATGEIVLDPEETRVLFVEAQDIWIISEEELDSYRKQAETLFQPLQNTSYFAQGATLKADIEVSLTKISAMQSQEKTPEGRIQSYRQAMLELQGVKEKLEGMKTLVASAGSVGTVFGFVGGVQTIAVWGLILILVAGFIFLALYMRVLMGMARPTVKKVETTESVVKELKKEVKKLEKIQAPEAEKKMPKEKKKKTLSLLKMKFVAIALVSAMATSGLALPLTYLVNRKPMLVSPLGERVHAQEPVPSPPTAEPEPVDVNNVTIVIPAESRAVNIRKEPTTVAPAVHRATREFDARKVEEFNGWIAIEFEINGEQKSGWVSQEFVEERE